MNQLANDFHFSRLMLEEPKISIDLKIAKASSIVYGNLFDTLTSAFISVILYLFYLVVGIIGLGLHTICGAFNRCLLRL